MIVIKNLKKSYSDNRILDNINLKVEKGEIYGLVGQSGSGKSTLLKCINRLESFQEGSLEVDGLNVKDLSFDELREMRKKVAMIFQGFSLVQRKSVFKNIALPMECWKADKSTIERRVSELAKVVGLSEKLNDKPDTLSGGQKQRVAIARALTLQPDILLCDECTSALDPANSLSIIELLRNLRDRFGITIVVVSHEMSVIQSLCDRASILKNGKIIETEAVNTMFLKESNALKELLGKTSTLDCHEEVVLSFSGKSYGINNYILYEIGKVMQQRYSVIDSRFMEMNEGSVFRYTIGCSEADRPALLELLKKYEVAYEILRSEVRNVE